MEQELLEHQLKEEKRLLDIENKIETLEKKIDTLTTDVSELVAAWKAANWLVGMVKWIGGLAAAATAIVTVLKLKG